MHKKGLYSVFVLSAVAAAVVVVAAGVAVEAVVVVMVVVAAAEGHLTRMLPPWISLLKEQQHPLTICSTFPT